MSAVLTFLASSAFRVIWGEAIAVYNRRQDHKHDLERGEQQERFAAAQHARNLAAIDQQHKLQVDVIRVQSEADEVKGFYAARTADAQMPPSGVKWVDALNQAIRPLCAVVAAGVWVGSIVARDFQVTDWDWELVALILGYYFADRSLSKRGK